MHDRIFVSEEIRVPLHGKTETLCQNIVTGCRSLLRALNIQLVRIVGDGEPNVGLGFGPHPGVGHLGDVV